MDLVTLDVSAIPEHECSTGDLVEVLGEREPIDAVADALVDDRGDANPAGLCQRFQTRRDVDPVAIDVFTVDDHVTEVDADP